MTADLQRSRSRLVTAQEEERRRLRRDLHDGLGPTLAAVGLQIELARSLLPPQTPAQGDAALSEAHGRTQEAIADLRRLVYGLRPPMLDELGLVQAIAREAESFQLAGGASRTRIGVEAEGELDQLPAAVEVAAYRIAQEAMTNVVRHAQASECAVRLHRDAVALRIDVSDDGVGLKGASQGVGISSMRERAAEVGGALEVKPERDGGTRVRARLPLG